MLFCSDFPTLKFFFFLWATKRGGVKPQDLKKTFFSQMQTLYTWLFGFDCEPNMMKKKKYSNEILQKTKNIIYIFYLKHFLGWKINLYS